MNKYIASKSACLRGLIKGADWQKALQQPTEWSVRNGMCNLDGIGQKDRTLIRFLKTFNKQLILYISNKTLNIQQSRVELQSVIDNIIQANMLIFYPVLLK